MSEEFTVDAPDARIHGVDTPGAEPPVLFLNGGFATRRSWRHVLARLGGTHRTVTFDARGRGRSGTPADWSLRAMIDDVDRVIEARGLDLPILVGWSHGATIAVCCAAEYPDLVGGLVLVDGAYPVSVLDEQGGRRVRERFLRPGPVTRVRAFLGGSARVPPREAAEVVIGTDEVNGGLQADLAALRCPTASVVGRGEHSGATNAQAHAIRAAAASAAARNDQLTLFGTTSSAHGRVLTRDAGLVASAIADVARRSIRRPDR
ncbi:alpha/beta fold hydrolase [Streptomyces sp. NPDC057494]|uniref:alpha/beta fold hydrolase n=1 Tax=Streptomyces sp. NPDC057494 TaxID=3346148 RepID=UPI00369E6259